MANLGQRNFLMANYNINKSDGTAVVITTGSIDNSFDIPFIGQDAINYGDDLATAQLRLLENFANSTEPAFGSNRTRGQLWYDTTASEGLKIFNGTSFDLLPLDVDVVHLTGAETIAGIKTFSSSASFTSAAVPFTVNSTTKVTNLNADLLDNKDFTFFATAVQGALADTAEQGLPVVPSDGFILSSTTGNVRSWISPTVGTGNVDPTDAVADSTTSVLLAGDPTGIQSPLTDSGLTYNAATNSLTTETFIGALSGNAATADLADLADLATVATTITLTDTESGSTFVVLSPAPTGDQGALTDEELIYNASTGALTSTSFVGIGTALTALTADNITTGVLLKERGGTGVILATGTGSSFVLNTNPTFVTRITTPVIRNGATGTTLEFNSGAAFRIVSETALDQASGAEVVDGSGVFRPVGFNIIPNTNQSGATTSNLNKARVGYSLRGTNTSGTKTYLVGADATIPDGATWIVKNLTTSTGVVIVTSDSGVTLRHLNGIGTVSSVSGADVFTLARGGIATVQKITDTEYEMWGIGLTGGA